MLLIVGSRRLCSLYAAPALCSLATYPAADFIATTQDTQRLSEIVRPGIPTDHLPPLSSTDMVYAAGSPKLVETVAQAAARAEAAFFADAFVANRTAEDSWLGQISEKISSIEVQHLMRRAQDIVSFRSRKRLERGSIRQSKRFWRNVA
jgi:hypothetical protein